MGLKGSDISLYARCVALADVFDALVSVRCYKSAWTPDNARNEILSERGTHFDPEIVDLFLAHYDEFLQVLAQYPDTQLPLKPASSM
jgi:response regulator RpfG family c-di-GMP phosphodiesterase